MSDTPPSGVSVTIDGRPFVARPGELIIEAAERAGVYIPRFCYHPRMEPVGMCRMCLVEVSGPRGLSLQPACFLRVSEGLEVVTSSQKARKAQEGVLEFLLVNHPLDCPVCDKGGECPLQDQAMSHGPGESRFVEEKRHFAKPIDIGPLVALDRERCIQCARCTRFSAEVAGDAEIDFASRGDLIEVAPFPTKPFSSFFSGNTVQICPVGALTARPYRFKSRPWDLEQVETTCTICSVGCRVVAQSSAGALVRYLGVDSDPVNQSWLCDKGRFSYESIEAKNRLTAPLLRSGDHLAEASWPAALAAVAGRIGEAAPGGVAAIGGARFSNEDAYAFARLLKGVVGTDSVDAQLGDGLPAEAVLALPRASIDEACAAQLVVLLAPDLREELPVLYLRLRDAARRAKLKILECSSSGSALSGLSAGRLGYLPGEAVRLVEALVSSEAEVAGFAPGELGAARQLLAGVSGPGPAGTGVVVVLGRSALSESGESLADAAALLAERLPGAKFLPALRRANVHGALEMGLAPGVLPGRLSLEAGGAHFAGHWGAVPAERGRDCRAILEAATEGAVEVLFLLGADPLADFPDRGLAEAALAAAFVVAVGTHEDASNARADVVLPVAGDGERTGTTTNLEGRVTRLAAKVVPPTLVWPAWVVASELARRLGSDLGFTGVEEISEEIAAVVPGHRGVYLGMLAEAAHRDGVVVPLAPVAVSPRPMSPRPIDPMATPGILAVEEQGAPLRVGNATPVDAGHEVFPEPEAQAGAVGPPAGGAGVSYRPGSPPRVAQRLDSYSHRLVVGRRLYDAGTLVQASPSLAPLAGEVVLSVHPAELARLGVQSGDELRVRSARGELVLPVVADERLHRQVVAVPGFLGADAGAGVLGLIDPDQTATDVRLETP